MKDRTIKWDGKTVTKPGMYAGVPLELYHAHNICDGPSISSSGLRALNPDLGSPAHFYDQWAGNPNRSAKSAEAEHFRLGRAVHHLLLGEPFFAKLFIQQPEEYVDIKTGEAKPWNNNATVCRTWQEQQRKVGRAVLTAKMIDQIKQICVSVGNHPLVKQGLFNGLIERSFFWRDAETGLWIKWRPDAVPMDSAVFGDIKTTTSTMWNDLARTLRDLAYYQQAALGRWACREVLDMDMESFTLLFAEKQGPWCTRDVRIEDQDLVRGERMNRACIRTFARCLKAKHWPGPGYGDEGNERLGLSDAAREAIDNRLKNEGLADGQD